MNSSRHSTRGVVKRITIKQNLLLRSNFPAWLLIDVLCWLFDSVLVDTHKHFNLEQFLGEMERNERDKRNNWFKREWKFLNKWWWKLGESTSGNYMKFLPPTHDWRIRNFIELRAAFGLRTKIHWNAFQWDDVMKISCVL